MDTIFGKTRTRVTGYSRTNHPGSNNEFPNYEVEDKFIMQEFFNQMKIKGHSMIISGQCCPENWDSLFEVQSFGQSIRGRITENACRLEMKGPDLRNYVPEET